MVYPDLWFGPMNLYQIPSWKLNKTLGCSNLLTGTDSLIYPTNSFRGHVSQNMELATKQSIVKSNLGMKNSYHSIFKEIVPSLIPDKLQNRKFSHFPMKFLFFPSQQDPDKLWLLKFQNQLDDDLIPVKGKLRWSQQR